MGARAADIAGRTTPAGARRFDTPCTITVEQSPDHFHAHVDLADGIEMEPGDKVRVHGDPIAIPFGSKAVFERTATVTRAGPLKRALTRFAAYFDLAELYEVSFNAGRIK
ncbi:hypothetical protein [Erythrobacter sp. JK5]|uniref:hypothetical protein n=1 Tax=Erythrobacter sp. JK5 TaxID=2829500 RepID=UPI001BAC3C82|nr:hypothetical protein [Erythrobacter sp. JK5]QUL38022.1 hypothetical protein KDC96_00890 [Erythrobacter sp. JK5]